MLKLFGSAVAGTLTVAGGATTFYPDSGVIDNVVVFKYVLLIFKIKKKSSNCNGYTIKKNIY